MTRLAFLACQRIPTVLKATALDTGETVDHVDFALKDHLPSALWYHAECWRLRPIVREALLKIAHDFFATPPVVGTLTDVTLTGSMANYNWSASSDIDLHLIVGFGGHERAAAQGMYDARRTLWNAQHDIRLEGFPVEIYVQDVAEPHVSTGVYSVCDDRWLAQPELGRVRIDSALIQRKARPLATQIDRVAELLDAGHAVRAVVLGNQIRDRLRAYRASGLERGGELAVENLVFKYLRRTGVLERLGELRRRAYDAAYSIGREEAHP